MSSCDTTTEIDIEFAKEDNYLYLVQPSNFLGSDVFKIGKSKNIKRRMVDYGIDTRIICIMEVVDRHKMERKMKEVFGHNFKRYKIGYEYYHGDPNIMRFQFVNVCLNDVITMDNISSPRESRLAEHTNIDEKICPRCDRVFADKHKVKAHLLNQKKPCEDRDKIPIDQETPCTRCCKPFKNKYTMKTHYMKKICKPPVPTLTK
tara:strand:+ start:28987 stop:29598 length:612 start_codon:yes stop_codon:yes gene_type:complete